MVQHQVTNMLIDVEEFMHEVIDFPVPDHPTLLQANRLEWFEHVIREEMDEHRKAHQEGSLPEAADAIVDMVYFGLGRLVEMGVTVGPVWDAVHFANMAKRRGTLSKRPNSMGYDAVKPEGWKAPDHSWLELITPEVVARLVEEDCYQRHPGPLLTRPNTPADMLHEAADIVSGNRAGTHGEAERSFTAIAELWTAWLQSRKYPDPVGLRASDVAMMMVLLKACRAEWGTPVRDHFVDMAGYAGLAGELALTTSKE